MNGECRRELWMERVKIAGIIVVLITAFGIVGAIDMRVEEATSAERHEAMQRLAAHSAADRAHWIAWLAAREIDYGICPPEDPAAPSVMVIIVENISDKHPLFRTCFRIPRPS
jgi:hypothetical protein